MDRGNDPFPGVGGRTALAERVRTPAVAWGIHLFTGTGIVFGLLGLLGVLDESPRAALLWLMVAQVVDGLDGPMARACSVKLLVPRVDGNTMDLVIDYVTCVLAPAVFVHQFGLLPHRFSLVGTGLILVSSLYAFSRTDLMTEDHFFNGFPAMWNLAVNVMWVLNTRRSVNLVVVVVLVVLTFMPVQFPHPVRVRGQRGITLPVTIVWLGTMAYFTAIESTPRWGEVVQILCVAWYGWLVIERTVRGPQPDTHRVPISVA
jgi:phosphatidylcholine synthase